MPYNYKITDIIKDTLTGNVQYVSNELYKQRLELCLQCPEHQFILPGDHVLQCKVCGCLMLTKAKYKRSSCPLPNPVWSPIDP